MNRRRFLTGAGMAGGFLLLGGAKYGHALWSRHQLTQQLLHDAMPDFLDKSYSEVQSLPAQANQEIRTWFHGPYLNAADFIYQLGSRSFVEGLSACSSAEDQEQYILHAFLKHVVSESEILPGVLLALHGKPLVL